MKLRTQIQLFLFVFALVPMLALTALNLPIVLSKLESFLHRTHIQSMRADFAPLKQYIASRQELVRILAKLVLPKEMGKTGNSAKSALGVKVHFSQWVDQLLRGNLDIFQIIYLDAHGKSTLHLLRKSSGAPLQVVTDDADYVNNFYFKIGISIPFEDVFIGPIVFNANPDLGKRFMNMHMVSPIFSYAGDIDGMVLINIDVSTLPNAHPNTIWVHNDGRYFQMPGRANDTKDAFADYPGLREQFTSKNAVLWKGELGRQVIWVPLFYTEKNGPLWVGRVVDPSDIDLFRQQLQARLFVVSLVLIISALFIARKLALKIERFGKELINGIGQMLENKSVVFSWRGPIEIRTLALELTRLADKHAKTSQALYARAKELEETNRYKSQFLANMSHELRTPLNAIISLSKILMANDSGRLDSEQIKQASTIHRGGTNLLLMINDILDIAKIEAQKMNLQLSSIQLQSIWQPMLDLFFPLANEKGLTIKVFFDANSPKSIVSDRDKIEQILKNFIGNAIKFTHKGGITLIVDYSADVLALRRVRLCVRDTGIGIEKNEHNQIFMAFHQADGSTSRRFGGTGLGLTISQELAELIGAKIELKSEVGHGTEFSLLLPIEFDAAHIDKSLVEFLPQEEVIKPTFAVLPQYGDNAQQVLDFSGCRVLVVDKMLENLLALTPVLEGWGVAIIAAGSCQELQDVIQTDINFDIVFINIETLGEDAATLIAQLQVSFFDKNTVIVNMSDAAIPSDIRNLDNTIMQSLTLPVDKQQLAQKFSGWFYSKL